VVVCDCGCARNGAGWMTCVMKEDATVHRSVSGAKIIFLILTGLTTTAVVTICYAFMIKIS